ncbi:hypothetical protein [Comamonas sp. 23]|uniref:hypothetical protein n=1 Tax=Comamonas sp. 23 TaxID=3415008 RepID=UPI003C6F13E1
MDHSIRPITQPARMQPANIQLHEYEITTIPPHVRPEDVSMLAEANRLPRTRFKAISADAARKTALHVLRDPIHDVAKIVDRAPQ